MPSPGFTITQAAAGDTHTPCVCRPCSRLAVIGDQRPGVLCTVPHIASWMRGVVVHLGISAHREPLYAGPYRIPYRTIYIVRYARNSFLLHITGLERKRPLHRAPFPRSATGRTIPIYRFLPQNCKICLNM